MLTSDWSTFEYLWPYSRGLGKFGMKFANHPVRQLEQWLPNEPKEAQIHIRETMQLFKRAEDRSAIYRSETSEAAQIVQPS